MDYGIRKQTTEKSDASLPGKTRTQGGETGGPARRKSLEFASDEAKEAWGLKPKRESLKELHLSPLDTVKTLPELLGRLPNEDHEVLRKAYERAGKAEETAEEEWIKKPDNDLVSFVEAHYNVNPTSPESGLLVPGYSFTSKEYPNDNFADIGLSEEKSTLVSQTLYRGRKEDGVHISDLQRYTCIKLGKTEKSINGHEILSNGGDAPKVLKILYRANAILSQGQATDTTLNLSKGSAAFKVLRGTEVNLSTIFLAKDQGWSTQSVTCHDNGFISSITWNFW
jgi:hypothetical protein